MTSLPSERRRVSVQRLPNQGYTLPCPPSSPMNHWSSASILLVNRDLIPDMSRSLLRGGSVPPFHFRDSSGDLGRPFQRELNDRIAASMMCDELRGRKEGLGLRQTILVAHTRDLSAGPPSNGQRISLPLRTNRVTIMDFSFGSHSSRRSPLSTNIPVY